jgi:hypothetical protein
LSSINLIIKAPSSAGKNHLAIIDGRESKLLLGEGKGRKVKTAAGPESGSPQVDV